MCVQVSNLERELEETRKRAAQFEEEVEEQTKGQDMQLLDSQVRLVQCSYIALYSYTVAVAVLNMFV